MERDQGRQWWHCDHCGDAWNHLPTDRCDALLAKLEAEHQAGWATVSRPQCDVDALLRIVLAKAKAAA